MKGIEAELLGGVLSLRTIAGRHGLSSSALHRHRRKHLKSYTVGAVLQPENPVYGDWRRWDGSRWQPGPRPRLEDLIEVHSRPSYDEFDYEHLLLRAQGIPTSEDPPTALRSQLALAQRLGVGKPAVPGRTAVLRAY